MVYASDMQCKCSLTSLVPAVSEHTYTYWFIALYRHTRENTGQRMHTLEQVL